MFGFVLVWIASAAAYLLFAGGFGADELAAAAACGLAGALWSAALARAAPARLRIGAAELGELGRAVAGLPRAAAQVAAELGRAIVEGGGGAIVRQALPPGVQGDAGRRAVAVLARSLAPDSFVVRDQAGGGEVVAHVLVRGARSRARRGA